MVKGVSGLRVRGGCRSLHTFETERRCNSGWILRIFMRHCGVKLVSELSETVRGPSREMEGCAGKNKKLTAPKRGVADGGDRNTRFSFQLSHYLVSKLSDLHIGHVHCTE